MTAFEILKKSAATYYEDALERFGDDPRGVNWSSQESQNLRFDILCQVGDLARQRVHDVGCGLAHLSDYLSKTWQGPRACKYVGSDISRKMIDAARRRVGDATELEFADILASTAPWMEADYVVNSGVFTVRGATPEAEWWDFVTSMIERMFALCRTGIAFNMMTSYVDYRDDHLFYKAPSETLDFCIRELSRRAVIRHDYPLWEYTVYVYK